MTDSILIAGDSYSDGSTRKSCMKGSIGRYSWIDLLSQDFNIHCVAQGGSSNYDIVKQVQDSASKNYTFLIVNVSGPHRNNVYSPRIDQKAVYPLSMSIAKTLAYLPNTLCWTPFKHYQSIKEIHFLPLTSHNEMYSEKAARSCTHHHLTYEGNYKLYSWMKKQIERVKSGKHTEYKNYTVSLPAYID